jgi:hypothetical protein
MKVTSVVNAAKKVAEVSLPVALVGVGGVVIAVHAIPLAVVGGAVAGTGVVVAGYQRFNKWSHNKATAEIRASAKAQLQQAKLEEERCQAALVTASKAVRHHEETLEHLNK